jgi:hypothetical protein
MREALASGERILRTGEPLPEMDQAVTHSGADPTDPGEPRTGMDEGFPHPGEPITDLGEPLPHPGSALYPSG